MRQRGTVVCSSEVEVAMTSTLTAV
jgi:hypothetical protein